MLRRHSRARPCDLPVCRRGALRIIAAITQESVITRILRHCKLASIPPPIAPARCRQELFAFDEAHGSAAYYRLPTLFLLDASDTSLNVVCVGGVFLSCLVILGIAPGPALALLWAFYLSLAVAGQVFLGYQWDALLLEAGLLAALYAPWGLWPRPGREGDEALHAATSCALRRRGRCHASAPSARPASASVPGSGTACAATTVVLPESSRSNVAGS